MSSIIPSHTVFGRGGSGGKGGGKSEPVGRSPVEAPNSLQSRSIARFLDLWCEGPIHGLVNEDQSIYFDDTPLKNGDGTFNFTGVAFDTRYGYPFGSQTYMAGFPSSRNTVTLEGGQGVEIRKSNGGVVRTVNNPQANAVIVKISTPALYMQNNETGDINPYTSNFRISVKAFGAASFVETHYVGFHGKTTSTYQRDYRVALPPGGAPWDIKIQRENDDDPAEWFKDRLYWTSYTEVVDGKLAHPNVAYCGVQIDTAQFNGSAPARSYDVKGLLIKIPSNYNPATRSYTGDWNGTFTTAWSDNPAWCFYDLLTNTRYGLGLDPAAVNPWKWDLYTIGQYCDAVDESGAYVGIDDGAGGKEPRYTCNMLLNSRQEAYAVVNTMASIFRGMPFWSSGAVRATADMPKAPVALFTNANVLGGEFKYEGTSLKARHTTAKVVWNDPADAYRPAVEWVDDPEGVALYGVRQIDIVAYGCTSRGQAIRAGKWVLDTERTATETVHFRSGLELADKFPGDIVSIADENYAQQIFGGRIVSSTLSSVTVDQPYAVLAAFSYTLHITMPDGTLQKRTLTNTAGETATFTWSTPLHKEPLAGAVWAITSTSLEARQFLLVSNIEVGPATFEAMGVFHDPAKFDRVEKGIVVPPPPYNVTPTGPIVAPTGPSSMMRLYQVGSAVRAAVLLSWAKSDDGRVYAYEVQVKGPQDIDYQTIGTTSMTSIEYQDSQEGTYDFRVRAKALNGKTSAWLEATNITLTTAIPPSDVGRVEKVYDPDGVAIKWPAVEDLNVDYYEVRRGPVPAEEPNTQEKFEILWNAATKVGTPRELRHTEKKVATGKYRYWVRAVSKPQGIYSVTPSHVDIDVEAPPMPVVTAVLEADQYKLSWPGVVSSGFFVEEYEIRYGADWTPDDPLSLISRVKGTSFSGPVRWGGNRKFWVAAKDKAGNYSTAGNVSLMINAASSVSNLTAQVVDNNVLLRWSSAISVLPIDHYAVRKGPTWGAGLSIGDKSGTFTSVFESAAGTYTYWVAAVDSGGNEGTPLSVTAVVNQPPDYILRTEDYADLGAGRTGHVLTSTAAGDTFAGVTSTCAVTANKTFRFQIWVKAGSQPGVVRLHLRDGANTEYGAFDFTPTSTWRLYSVQTTFPSGAVPNLVVYVNPLSTASAAGQTLLLADAEIIEVGSLTNLIASEFAGGGWYYSNSAGAQNVVPGPFDGVLTNLTVQAGVLYGPADTTETWLTHFTDQGWDQPQDQIDAGYVDWLDPGPSTAKYVEVFDYDSVVQGTLVTISPSKNDFSGSVSVSIGLESSLDGVNWTMVGTGSQQYVSNFRYLRVTLDLSSAGAVCAISAISVKLASKMKTDADTVNANASDSGGTLVTFNTPFASVTSIQVSPVGTAARYAIYDFAGVPYPTSFKVLVFDAAGNRISGQVSWTARGY